MPDLRDIRTQYDRTGLTESEAGDDPFSLFRRWFDDVLAANLPDPNAFTLATCTPAGRPGARIVLLKGLDERGFTFFTNYNSRKGREIAANPHVALCFYWHSLERQVRVEGTIEMVSGSESDEYYAVRPLGSRLGAWASPQSEIVPDRETLAREMSDLEARFAGTEPPRPSHWGGYRVTPEVIEFWQGRPNRLHDRIRFTRTPTGWSRDRLAP